MKVTIIEPKQNSKEKTCFFRILYITMFGDDVHSSKKFSTLEDLSQLKEECLAENRFVTILKFEDE